MASEPVRARDVRVETYRRAECLRPGCPWAGEYRLSFANAHDDRQRHLDEHKRQRVASAGDMEIETIEVDEEQQS